MSFKLLSLSQDGFLATPDPSCVVIKEFKEIIDRASNVNEAARELAYVFHMVDVSSPYASHGPEQREERIRQQIMGEDWEPDDVTRAAMKRYEDLKMGPLERLLASSMAALHKTKEYLDRIDFSETVDDGEEEVPRYGPRDVQVIMNILGSLGKTVDGINKLREQVEAEQTHSSQTMKGVEVDPIFNDV